MNKQANRALDSSDSDETVKNPKGSRAIKPSAKRKSSDSSSEESKLPIKAGKKTNIKPQISSDSSEEEESKGKTVAKKNPVNGLTKIAKKAKEDSGDDSSDSDVKNKKTGVAAKKVTHLQSKCITHYHF